MKEADLSPQVTRWLQGRQLIVYTEVPHFASAIDVVGYSPIDDKLVAVELKTSLSSKLIHQAALHQSFVDESYCAVPTQPRKAGILRCKKLGLGLLVVSDEVDVVCTPTGKESIKVYRNKIIERLYKMKPGGIGGMPNREGHGPAQDVYRRVQEYRRANPRATWKDTYVAVPNYYLSYRNLYSAMRMVEERNAWKDRIRSNKRSKEGKK